MKAEIRDRDELWCRALIGGGLTVEQIEAVTRWFVANRPPSPEQEET